MLTPKQAAALLGITTETLRRWTSAGQINAYLTPGGHRRYREEDVGRALDAVAVAAPAHFNPDPASVHALQELHNLPAWSNEDEMSRIGEICFRFRLTIIDASTEPHLKRELGLVGERAAGYRSGGALYSADFECEAKTFGEALTRIVGAIESSSDHLHILEVRRLGVSE